MSTSVTMPRLGESVTEGTVTRWLKAEGDTVEADEPLLEVSTDKVDTEVPSPASGTLLSIKVAEDETVEIGVELAVIGDAGEAGGDSASEPAAAAPEPEPEPEPTPEPTPEPEPAPAPPQAAAPAPTPPQQAAPQTDYAPPADVPAPANAASEPTAATGGAATPQATASTPAESDDDAGAAYVTPLVRKLASERGVDLSTVQGTGVGGRIRKSDVLAAAPAPEPEPEPEPEPVPTPAPVPASQTAAANAPQSTPAPTASNPAAAAASAAPAPKPARGRTEKLSRLRSVIAARMVESLHTSAQLTTVVEIDVTSVARLRERAGADFAAREGVKLSFNPFFAMATIEALKEHANVNASIDTDAGTVTYHDAVHLGVAVDTERGLLVPVVHGAGDLNLGGLARKIADLAERTRTNKVTPDELGGGTFTLTNTGSRGALFDTPIINQPQVGILGTGAVVKRPVVLSDPSFGETIAVRSMVYFALTYDHRLVDGADAARFLGTVKARLEKGSFEAELGLN